MLKGRYIFFFLVLVAVLGTLSFNSFKNTAKITPAPKIFKFDGELDKISIEKDFGENFRKKYNSLFDWLDKDFDKLNGAENTLELKVEENSSSFDSLNFKPDEFQSLYLLERNTNKIKITATDTSALLNGLVTLKKLIDKNSGKLNQGYIIDWPDHSTRVFHFVSRNVEKKTALELLKRARLYNFNKIIVQIADGVKLESMEGEYLHNAWRKEFLYKYSMTARELGMEFIPEIKFLTHQRKLFKNNYPDLMFNKFTYDPTLNETKDKFTAILDEILEVTKASSVHIGHDELFGAYEYHPNSDKKLKKEEESLPPELFKESVLFLHKYLSDKNIEVWMWGDMFLDRDKYPAMFKWSNHGNEEFASLIDDIPKDIVICDWHYFDNQREFSTSEFFIEKGFKTIGASWKKEKTIKNFSNYLSKFDDSKKGMMATTWFHVQRKEWEIVFNTMQTSSEYFWNAK